MQEQSNSTEKSFFCIAGVDVGGEALSYKPIEIIFQTLILKKCEKPYTWYKNLGYDKSWASKVRRGLIIPKLEDRIKIAQYFQTDTSAIWRVSEIIGGNKNE